MMLFCLLSGRFVNIYNASSVTIRQQLLTRIKNSRRCYTRGKPFPPIKVNAPVSSEKVNHDYDTIEQFCLAGGTGQKRHVKLNRKVLVRDRIRKILDEEADFFELCLIAGVGMPYGDVPSAGIVAGIGKVHGHYCMIVANDATVKGGTYYPVSVVKSLRCQEIAENLNVPVIYLVDSGGAFLPLQSEIFPDRKHGGRNFYNQAIINSKGIGQIAIVCGSCTAGGAYCPTMSQEAIITQRIGTIFLGGPPLVKAALGEVVSDEELGGALLHSQTSGCTDYLAEDEEESFSACRDAIATLNMNSVDESKDYDEPLYLSSSLAELGGVNALDRQSLYYILSTILDGSRFREFKTKFGSKLVTGYGYICGNLVGIVACHGSLSSADSLKGCHFIQLAEQRSIPLVFLQGSTNENDKNDPVVLKDRAKMAAAVATSAVPKVSINLRVSSFSDNLTMCGPGFSPTFNFAWPSAKFYMSMNATSCEEKEDTTSKKKRSLSAFEFLPSSAFYSAGNCLIDGIMRPEDTRDVLAHCLRIIKYGEKQTLNMLNLPVLRM